MSATLDLTTKGRILGTQGPYLVFAPTGTSYELHLLPRGDLAGNPPINVPLRLRISAVARKLLTVPSGGSFITPIIGTPRILQGRVRHIENSHLVLQAGALVRIQLPEAEHAIDLNHGAIAVGQLVNVTLLPGASAEPA